MIAWEGGLTKMNASEWWSMITMEKRERIIVLAYPAGQLDLAFILQESHNSFAQQLPEVKAAVYMDRDFREGKIV